MRGSLLALLCAPALCWGSVAPCSANLRFILPALSPRVAQALPAVEVRPEEATALLDAWLGAQNKADFEAYSRLYAQRFHGIKRAGKRTRTYNRAGWLADRKGMFKGGVTVEAADIRVRSGGVTAQVRFTQTWASKRYKDVGPKILFLVREGEALRIAREEMLESKVLEDKAEAPVEPMRWGFVLTSGGAQLAVVERGTARGCAAAPKLIGRSPAEVRCALKPQAGDLTGRAVNLYGEGGRLCQARLGAPHLLVKFQPHFGQVQDWRERYTRPQIISEIISHANSWDGFLTYAVEGEGGCAGARWFRGAERPEVRFAPGQDLDYETEEDGLRALRALPGWRTRQKEYAAWRAEAGVAGPRRWDQHERHAVKFMRYRLGRQVYEATSVSAGRGCGDFGDAMWGIWGGERLLTDPKHPGPLFTPRALIKIDGALFFLDYERLVRPIRGVYEVRESVEIQSYDCPC